MMRRIRTRSLKMTSLIFATSLDLDVVLLDHSTERITELRQSLAELLGRQTGGDHSVLAQVILDVGFLLDRGYFFAELAPGQKIVMTMMGTPRGGHRPSCQGQSALVVGDDDVRLCAG
jgi:hypothetical protein